MKGMTIKKVVASIVVAVALVFPAHSAFAVTEDSSYEADVAEYTALLGNKITTEQMDARLQEAARNADVSKEELVKYQIAVFKNPEVARYKGRSGGGTKQLEPAAAGDYFFTDIGHEYLGHTGIYVNNVRIVEATGPWSAAREAGLHEVKVVPGRSQILRVRTSDGYRKKAAARARTYVGRGYNAAFFNKNKDDNGGLMCSQLVWAAYYYGAGIDLDTKLNDDVVWPVDLRDSAKAYVIKYM